MATTTKTETKAVNFVEAIRQEIREEMTRGETVFVIGTARGI